MRHSLTNSLTGEEVEVTRKSSMFLPIFECAPGTQPTPFDRTQLTRLRSNWWERSTHQQSLRTARTNLIANDQVGCDQTGRIRRDCYQFGYLRSNWCEHSTHRRSLRAARAV
ncbi:hypothetical protein CROQUDRAFT_88802 [Cronartium quercuum f. sp. fusiforme G11]|uniref:Uncharacterized protein n=1 Tax=Cronartium quercuum f. sp. fusiforme G11 TaxID=708437 RepID=A0A9P6NUD6_9BASI|nr:hypothetical protein CROQUDRAFT_88802 [Cronartium quercuum f. sp. fusiforme G11]